MHWLITLSCFAIFASVMWLLMMGSRVPAVWMCSDEVAGILQIHSWSVSHACTHWVAQASFSQRDFSGVCVKGGRRSQSVDCEDGSLALAAIILCPGCGSWHLGSWSALCVCLGVCLWVYVYLFFSVSVHRLMPPICSSCFINMISDLNFARREN